MTASFSHLSRALGAAFLLLATTLAAHEGHDHGKVPAPPPIVEPRFTVSAGTLELTGVLGPDRALWCYVSHRDSNAAWSGLKLEIDLGGRALSAEPRGEGVYRIDLQKLDQAPGSTVVISVEGEGVEELLTAQMPKRAELR